MKKSSVFKLVAFVLSSLLLVGLAWWLIARSHAPDSDDQASTGAPARATTEAGGQPIITVDRTSQIRSGIATLTLPVSAQRSALQTFGTVLDPSDLVVLQEKAAAAEAGVQRASASRNASAAEYRRLKALHAGRHDVSERALQAAEAAWQGDEASLRAATSALSAVRLTAEQQWGAAIAKAVFEHGKLFEQWIHHDQVLVQVLLPAGTVLPSPPRAARLKSTDGPILQAAFVSASPRADIRLQGASLFYTAEATSLLPGMTVWAYLPTGQATDGVVVPSSAVVWLQGKAWVYAQIQPGRFERFALALDTPADDGWFAAKGFAAGAPIVVTGAQLLLSEEQRGQIGSSGDGDND